MRELKADLHLHTCLSPCAELEMVPTAIVRQAKSVGLDIIAVCDHNSVANALSVAKVGARESLAVIPGIEITSREEVHILGLFGSERELDDIQRLVDANLAGENDEEVFGLQVVVDEWDEPKELETRLLIGATALTLEEVVDAIHGCGGLAIAAHIDREGFGLVGQLGLIPPGLPLDALEVSPRVSHREWVEKWPRFAVITSSDAHCLVDIGQSSTSFLAAGASLDEIGKAIAQKDGRKVVVH
jgi:predicted metal-dependent phosphoesterase TrpH